MSNTILMIKQRVDFKVVKVGVITYRCLHGTAPKYLTEMLTPFTNDPGRRHLYSAARGIVASQTNTKTLG